MTVQAPFRPFTIRELSAADAHACAVFIRHLDPEDIRLRFASWHVSSAHLWLRNGTADGVAFVAVDATDAVLGVINLVPLTATATEIAVIVRSDCKRGGIGRALLGQAGQWATAAGVGELA